LARFGTQYGNLGPLAALGVKTLPGSVSLKRCLTGARSRSRQWRQGPVVDQKRIAVTWRRAEQAIPPIRPMRVIACSRWAGQSYQLQISIPEFYSSKCFQKAVSEFQQFVRLKPKNT
tara:strand:+ start:489 stop:839 length:351 start_codon:yes stop_codon:yes gene_type:complete